MERIFFEEKQRLPGIVVWLVAFTSLALCFPLMWGLYSRNILLEPWGRDSFSNSEIIFSALLVAAIGGFVVWLVSRISLEVKIDRTGIRYRYFPRFVVEQQLKKEMISHYEVRALNWKEVMKSQRSRKFGQKNEDQFLTMNGRNALVLSLQGGNRYFIGTENPEGLLWAMKKLMSNS